MNTFETVESKVTPRHLVPSAVSPFLRSLTIRPCCQSRGILSVLQTSLKSGHRMLAAVAVSALSSSAATLSGSAALLFLSSLMASLI